jgi:hypothetical protein
MRRHGIRCERERTCQSRGTASRNKVSVSRRGEGSRFSRRIRTLQYVDADAGARPHHPDDADRRATCSTMPIGDSLRLDGERLSLCSKELEEAGPAAVAADAGLQLLPLDCAIQL